MTALFLVLIASLLVAGLFLAAFIWSVRKDQFTDHQGNALRVLFGEAPSPKQGKHSAAPSRTKKI